ncbi:MAG: hypothetical protein WBZ42_09500 [Halobacteriota archaeon]
MKSEAAHKLYNTMLRLRKTAIAILILLGINSVAFFFIYFAFFAPFSEYVRMLASSFIVSVFGVVTIVFVIFFRSVTDIETIHITSSSAEDTEDQEIRRLDLIKELNYMVELALFFLFIIVLVYSIFVKGNGNQLLQQWPIIVSIVIAFSFLGITLPLMYDLDLNPKNPTEHYPELKDLVSQGWLIIPKRCHMGDTHNISLSLNPAVKKALSYFEVELQGAGLKVNGDLKQQQLIDSSDISYLWNCNFSISGTQVINLIMRLAGSSECKSDILIKSYEVEVLSRYRQWIPPMFVAIATIFSVTIGLLHSIGF